MAVIARSSCRSEFLQLMDLYLLPGRGGFNRSKDRRGLGVMCYSIMSALRVTACVLRFTWLGVPNPMIRPRNTNMRHTEDSRGEEVWRHVLSPYLFVDCVWLFVFACMNACRHVHACAVHTCKPIWNSLETTALQLQASVINRNSDFFFEPACTPLVKLQMIKS